MNKKSHMDYLHQVTQSDIEVLKHKELTYEGSWKKRGGVGVFMMLARKWDRLENMLKANRYDVFDTILAAPHGTDGSVLAEVRDLRRYLILVEAEMVARGIVFVEEIQREINYPGTPEDGGHHANGENYE